MEQLFRWIQLTFMVSAKGDRTSTEAHSPFSGITVLRSWLVSLVEREASLKHQHLLTAALLNRLDGEPLLENLPFTRDSRTHRFSLSLHDFRQRRLSLISSILSNMRQHYHATRSFQPADHQEGTTSNLCNTSSRSCSSTLPTFVVSTHSLRTPQHSHFRRVGGQQGQKAVGYLRSRTMDGAYRGGDSGTPGLSHVLLTAVFPAFLRSALSSSCAWMLALPVLQANSYALGELFYYIRMESAASVETYLGIIGGALSSLQQPLAAVFDNPGLLRLPHVHAVLAQVFGCSRVPLTAIDFLSRIGADVSSVRLELDAIRSRGSEIHAYLSGSQRHLRDPVDHVPPRHVQWKDTVDFSQYELEHALKERWQASEGGYQVRWGSTIREVVVPLGDEEEESEGLLASIERYDGAFEAIVQGLGRMRVVTRPESCSLGAVMYHSIRPSGRCTPQNRKSFQHPQLPVPALIRSDVMIAVDRVRCLGLTYPALPFVSCAERLIYKYMPTTRASQVQQHQAYLPYFRLRVSSTTTLSSRVLFTHYWTGGP
ncbi:hypothetical protein KC363_g15 [Hortaea werneckii]|nr:hypothetical protein KC363_g15 [Hortaea werneckii]